MSCRRPSTTMVDAVVRRHPPDDRLAARADRRPRLRQGLQHGELADPGRQPSSRLPPASTGSLAPAHRPWTRRSRSSPGGTAGQTAGRGTPRADAVDDRQPVQRGGPSRRRHRRPAGRVRLRHGLGTGVPAAGALRPHVRHRRLHDPRFHRPQRHPERQPQLGRGHEPHVRPILGEHLQRRHADRRARIRRRDSAGGLPGRDRSELRARVQGPGRQSRPQRTAVVGGQQTTFTNGEGPGGGEFLNDRRDQGTGGNHNENTLGSVVTYPGVDEIASSAMDPYSGINRNGLMWFDQNTGVATRGFDQVVGDAGQPRPRRSRRAAGWVRSRCWASRRRWRSATGCGWTPT